MKHWKNVLSAMALLVMSMTGIVTAQSNDDVVVLSVDILTLTDGEVSEIITVTFDMPELQAFPAVSFKTETIWTEGEQTFKGVSLAALVSHLGVTSGTLRAQAINDYVVDIPVSNAVEGGPIIAYERNGAPMSIRDKGPLWIVYPYDNNSDYKTEEIFSQSVWQLVRITVKPAN